MASSSDFASTGLVTKPHVAAGLRHFASRRLYVGGDDHDFRRAIQIAEPPQHLDAIHVLHRDIEHDGRGLLQVVLLQSTEPVLGLQDLVSCGFQNLARGSDAPSSSRPRQGFLPSEGLRNRCRHLSQRNAFVT